jgi:SAM-dependent methyltransferase
MDLRPFSLSPADVATGASLLSYQPIVLSDRLVTGCAHSWLYEDDPEAPELSDGAFVFDRDKVGPEKFDRALAANLALIRTYEHFADEIASRFAGASFLDVSCNTGLFPVMVARRGMGDCAGLEPKPLGDALAFLARVTGTRARFMRGGYLSDPVGLFERTSDKLQRVGRFDVVSNMAFLCHLGEPLQFLQALADVASKAVFIWSGFLDDPEYVIRLNEPRPDKLAGDHRFFWQKFASGSAMSVSLLKRSMALLGFASSFEVQYPLDGLPPDWTARHMPHYGPFRAFLFVRG